MHSDDSKGYYFTPSSGPEPKVQPLAWSTCVKG